MQGQSRRVQVEVKSVQESGTLPLMEECVLSVGIGCAKVRALRSPKTQETFHVSFCAFSVLVERPSQTRESFRTCLPQTILSVFLLFSFDDFFPPFSVFAFAWSYNTWLLVFPWYMADWELKHQPPETPRCLLVINLRSLPPLRRNPLLACKDYLPAGVWFPLGCGTVNPAGKVLYWFPKRSNECSSLCSEKLKVLL